MPVGPLVGLGAFILTWVIFILVWLLKKPRSSAFAIIGGGFIVSCMVAALISAVLSPELGPILNTSAKWGIAVGICMVFVSFPKVDRRFKTGYKNNKRPNIILLRLGFGIIGFSIVYLVYYYYVVT